LSTIRSGSRGGNAFVCSSTLQRESVCERQPFLGFNRETFYYRGKGHTIWTGRCRRTPGRTRMKVSWTHYMVCCAHQKVWCTHSWVWCTHQTVCWTRSNVCWGRCGSALHTSRFTDGLDHLDWAMPSDTWTQMLISTPDGVSFHLIIGTCRAARYTFNSKPLRGTTRAEDAQGTPTPSHISPSILVY